MSKIKPTITPAPQPGQAAPGGAPLVTEHKLPDIGAIIAVASGKGGVGKSTIAANLAVALSKLDLKVGLLDADFYGPSQHIMFGLKDQQPTIDSEKKILPINKHGLKLLSFGFFVPADQAVIWRGPMIARMFQQFIDDVRWGKLDYLIIDLPPGTGDIQLTLTQLLSVTGVIMVSTPQDVALADAIKGTKMFQKVNVNVMGLVENMSTFVCPHCNHESHIFSKGGGIKESVNLGIPFLGEIPLEEPTRSASDAGVPIVLSKPDSPQAERFLKIARQVNKDAEKFKSMKTLPPQNQIINRSQGFEV